jgi:hypothetical protein
MNTMLIILHRWHWWEKIELGTAPPWAIFLAGGKTEPVIAMPRSILKSGGTKLDIDHRKPSTSDIRTRMLHRPVVDGAGRLRLKTGDTVGIVIDCGSKAGDGSVTFFVNGIKAHETCHLYVEPGEKWYPFVCLGSTKIKVRMLSTGESLNKKMWDKPEEQTVSKADIQAARGEAQFPGSGWLLSKEASSGKWKRGWYSLQVDSFTWTPYSVLHITLHKGRNLTAMDAGGTSDPFVEFRCGKKPWVDSMGRNAEGFTVVKSKTIDKTLNPVWNEKMQLKLYETEGVLSITCFDKDILGSDVIGHAHIDMSDIRSLSCIGPGGLKRLTNRCFVLKQPGDAVGFPNPIMNATSILRHASLSNHSCYGPHRDMLWRTHAAACVDVTMFALFSLHVRAGFGPRTSVHIHVYWGEGKGRRGRQERENGQQLQVDG